MKIDLTVEKNVVLKRDKPWSRFYSWNDEDLLCSNDQHKFESVHCANGRIDHLSSKFVANNAKVSIAHGSSNNGQFCAFLSPTFDVTIWDKDKLIQTIPPCALAGKAIQTKPIIFVSNSGEQVLIALQRPCRLFMWLKTYDTRLGYPRNRRKVPICSQSSSRAIEQTGNWYELTINESQWQGLNTDQNPFSIDVFFRSKHCSAICALVFLSTSGYLQINRLDIDWKPTIYAEQTLSYMLEIVRLPFNKPHQLNTIRFAHNSPILGICLSTEIFFVSLTPVTMSKSISVECSSSKREVRIADLAWSFDDHFLIGLTNRGALFFVHRFGDQIQLKTLGDCISQGPSSFIILHPLIGEQSEATNHLGLDSFFRSVAPLPKGDKSKEQVYSLVVHSNKPWLFCSDGYRLASLTYSDSFRDRRFYDPLLYIYLMDSNQKNRNENYLFLEKPRSFEDLPKSMDQMDNESIGVGINHVQHWSNLTKYPSLNSLTDETTIALTLNELFTAYQLLLTSSDRIRHDMCSCLERMTQSLLHSATEQNVLTIPQLSRCLSNLTLSSTFGALNFLHLSCLAKFVPLFLDIFQQKTSSTDTPELVTLSFLLIIEQWLQSVSHIPSRVNTFELYRQRKPTAVVEDQTQTAVQLCKGISQLQLLQGTKINLDEFLSASSPNREQNRQAVGSVNHRLTLVRSWYELWSTIERKSRNGKREAVKYLLTIRLFIQSLLSAYPSLNTIRLVSSNQVIDLNDIFPPMTGNIDHPLYTKGYTTLNERRKQRRRVRLAPEPTTPTRPNRRTKPPTESRKALVLHRILYALLEQYQIRDALCVLNVALKRETAQRSSCIPLDLFNTNLFQQIDTRTHFGMPGQALQATLRTMARFMARSMVTNDHNGYHQPLFVYSVDSGNPLPNLFQANATSKNQNKCRIIYIDRVRLNIAVEQQQMRKFWQPLKVIELFILGQSVNEAILFAKLIGDWRAAVCLASSISWQRHRTPSSYSANNSVGVDALLYTKLCEYLQVDNLKSLLKRTYKQDEILSFLNQLPSTLEQFLLCSTLLRVPIVEMLFKRLNATMIYLFTLLPIMIPSKFYLPCPPIYQSILHTYDDEQYDITCKYEIHIRLLFYRTLHIFIQTLSASRIQFSCVKWYLDHLLMNENRRKSSNNLINDSFTSIRLLAKSLRFHRLPDIPDQILVYFRDFCAILFLIDLRDRLSLCLRQYIRDKVERRQTGDTLAWRIIGYATLLLSFHCLLTDEIMLLRAVLNIFFDLPPSEQLMRALAKLVVARQYDDNDRHTDAEFRLILDQLKARWASINPTYVQLYEEFLETIIVRDVQEDIIRHYLTLQPDDRNGSLFDLKPKWFETCYEYGEFMTFLIPHLIDTSSLNDTNQQESTNLDVKFDRKSIPLISTMSTYFRELELPPSLDKRYLMKQTIDFVPPNEFVVFPVRMVHYDHAQTMFHSNSPNVNYNTAGSYVHNTSNEQPPDVVTLQHQNQYQSGYHPLHDHQNHMRSDNSRGAHPLLEWDGRSDDPSRSHIRQFDPPYEEDARQAIWMSQWNQRNFNTSNERVPSNAMRIPISAQTLISTTVLSDPARYESTIKNSKRNQNDQDQYDNDSELTDVTKGNGDEDGNGTPTDRPLSPRRRDPHPRKNSLDESMSLPITFNEGNMDLNRSQDFRAPSRDTVRDETPTYDIAEFPTRHYTDTARSEVPFPLDINQQTLHSPPISSGFQQQHHPLRSSHTDRRFIEDSDPNLVERLTLEDREKFTVPETNRTQTSRQSPSGRDASARSSPTRPPSSPDRFDRGSSPRRSRSKKSPKRRHSSRRSPSRRDAPFGENQIYPTLQHTPPYYPPSSMITQAPYPSSIRLPLLRLGYPALNQGPSSNFYPTSQAPSFPSITYSPAPKVAHIPIPRLQFAPQLPAPAALSPRSTRADQEKNVYVQNVMSKYAEQARPRLQLLQLRPPASLPNNPQLNVPMPAPNVLTTSSENKIETGVQVEVPRRDGYQMDPELFRNLLLEVTGVNFTAAEAHFSAARQIQQQAIQARQRERSTMTDLPAHQILYDLQYARGGEGDERKFVNVTDIAGPHVDSLLAQIERDRLHREQQQPVIPSTAMPTTHTNGAPPETYQIGFSRQQDSTIPSTAVPTMHMNGGPPETYQIGFNRQQQPTVPPAAVPTTHMNGGPPGTVQLGFNRQQQEIEQPLSSRPNYRIGFDQQNIDSYQHHEHLPKPVTPSHIENLDESERINNMLSQRQHQRELEQYEAERLAFGNIDTPKSSRRVTYEPGLKSNDFDELDIPLDYLIRQPSSREPKSDRSVVPATDRSSARSSRSKSPRTKIPQEDPISIKFTVPRDPFSSRKAPSPRSNASSVTSRKTTVPRKAASPTIADRHRQARLLQQKALARQRDQNTLEFADQVLRGDPLPPTDDLQEFHIEPLETSFTSTVVELAGNSGMINRTYDLDFMDDEDDIDQLLSDRPLSRPMSATTSNMNQSALNRSNSSSSLQRPSSTSSVRRPPQMTPMAKAILQVKRKGPPPARSNMARKRPMSSPANLVQKQGSMTAPARSNQPKTRLVPTIRKASPPSHKPTTYNERVRQMNKTDGNLQKANKTDSYDPKALMRLYGTRRVPGLYRPYEKTDPRVTKTYAERMQELQQSGSTSARTTQRVRDTNELDIEARPSSAPSSSITLSDWEVDDRVKELLADEPDNTFKRKPTNIITPLGNLDELDDEDPMYETTYSLTRVTEQTNENTYGDDLRLLQTRRPSGTTMNNNFGTRMSARSSAGGDMTARDESELSRGASSIGSYLDWSQIDRMTNMETNIDY